MLLTSFCVPTLNRESTVLFAPCFFWFILLIFYAKSDPVFEKPGLNLVEEVLAAQEL